MEALSKGKIKFIHSLESKKTRKEQRLFLAEGPKLVGDLLGHFPCLLIVGTPEWFHSNNKQIQAREMIEVKPEELKKASLLKTPQDVLAVFKQPYYEIDLDLVSNALCLGLDGIQDPGNLGTIIRLADWFGFSYVFCSTNTADIYNPKAIQATMGGIARVKVIYTDLSRLIRSLTNFPVYGTFLEGESLYDQTLPPHALVIMGNEGNGIEKTTAELINKRLYIPCYGPGKGTVQSLNVATATAIVCAEFRRPR